MNKIYDEITIVTVLYNSAKIDESFFENLKNFKTIVVDNGKNEEILNKIKTFKNIKIISKNKNLGYGGAVNFAFENITTKFFLLLNPDININENSINNLHNILSEHSDYGIVAPITYPDGDFYGVFPEKNLKNLTMFQALKSRDLLSKTEIEGEICVDVVKWALLIKAKQFEEVGGFNEKLFLFWEEIDLCRRFRSKKISVIITPKSKAEHKQNKSSESNFQNFLIKTYYHEYSPLVYFNVQKFSFFYFKRMMKYLFRAISYLLILNLKKSLIYLLRLSASLKYFIDLKFSSTK